MRTSRRSVSSLLGLAIVVAATGGLHAADPIKIGLFVPLTGGAAPTGNSIREAVTMAVNEKNAAGGVLGRPIELIVADDAMKPEEAINIARRFASRENVLVAIGSVTSPVSLAAAQVFGEAEVPHIVVTSTAQTITMQGNQWVFRSAAPDTKLINDIVGFITQKLPKAKKFAILSVNDDFGKGGVDTFKAAAARAGLEIVGEERLATGDLDFTAQLTHIRDMKPDAIFEWTRYTEGSLIARQMMQMGLNTIPHFGSDSFAAPKYIELTGEAANGVMYPSPFSPAISSGTPEAQALTQKLKAAYNKVPDYNHVQAYDAITIAISAIERAGKADRTAVRDAIRKTDFKSPRGHFTFDAKGDPTFDTTIVKVVDGKETDARK
jgi:branched-chain amino acid transport system substrate-binding protein